MAVFGKESVKPKKLKPTPYHFHVTLVQINDESQLCLGKKHYSGLRDAKLLFGVEAVDGECTANLLGSYEC